MKIYYENSMPYAQEFFGELGECQAFSGPELATTPAIVSDADVLLVRSTTRVNQQLIAAAPNLKFVATATAGYNHLDLQAIEAAGIHHYIAAGCNANAVAQYVLSALSATTDTMNWDWTEKTIGIVGAGKVGTALSQCLDALGVSYLLCDPPLAASGDARQLASLDDIMQCDVITLHTPLETTGPTPTHHLFDADRLSALRSDQLLINACRGEVIDNQALLRCFEQGQQLKVVLDVWENEPDVLLPLCDHVLLATAHIAGHSIEGKANGTEMVYRALCQFLNRPAQIPLSPMLPAPQQAVIDIRHCKGLESVSAALLHSYDIRCDDQRFRREVNDKKGFSYIRKHYPIRREFFAYQLKAGNDAKSQALYGLGFQQAN